MNVGCIPLYLFSLCSCLEKTAIFKVFFDDDVCHSVEHDLDVLCVCGTRQVGVDFFYALLHVKVHELVLDVVGGIVICVGTYTKLGLCLEKIIVISKRA